MTVGTYLGRFYQRMPWFVHYLTLLVPLAMSMVDVVDSGKRLPFYWNSSNPFFQPSNQTLSVNLGDRIDFFCPHYVLKHSSQLEYYVIYMVSKEEYEKCVVYEPKNATLLTNCSSPHKVDYFTLYVREFQSFPNVPDFKKGERHYVISTSKGSLLGINNQWGGACQKKGMRLILDICCVSSTHPTTTRRLGPEVTQARSTAAPPVRTKQTTTTDQPTTTTKPIATSKPLTTTTRKVKSDTVVVAPDAGNQRPKIIKDSEINATGPKNMGLINGSDYPRYSWTLLFVLIHICRWFLFSR